MSRFITSILFLAVCSFSVAAGEPGTGESFTGPVGMQLYSLRAEFLANGVAKTLDQVKAMGITNCELAGVPANTTAEAYNAQLEERGLKPISGHFGYDKLKSDPESCVKEAKALGLKFAGCAWISHKPPFNEAACRDAIAVFNKAGEAFAKEGIRFFYHTHGYEFHPHGDGTLFDLFMQETKKEFVGVQMDVLWVVFPGKNPVELLGKYAGRWESLHLKDLKKGVAIGSLSGGTDKKNNVVLGTGQMDWPAILKAAKAAGVKYYFIEDESPDAATQIPQSMKYLESVKF